MSVNKNFNGFSATDNVCCWHSPRYCSLDGWFARADEFLFFSFKHSSNDTTYISCGNMLHCMSIIHVFFLSSSISLSRGKRLEKWTSKLNGMAKTQQKEHTFLTCLNYGFSLFQMTYSLSALKCMPQHYPCDRKNREMWFLSKHCGGHCTRRTLYSRNGLLTVVI